MSFELLDALLMESGHAPTGLGGHDNSYLSEDSDSEMFSDLDNLVESAMRESLRTTILESSLPDDVKVGHISVVEEAEFTPEQIYTFMQENIRPVLNIVGTLNESVEDKIFVSLPVYEVANTLYYGNKGMLTQEGSVVSEPSSKEGSLFNTLFKESSVSGKDQTEIMYSNFRSIIETYGVSNEEEFDAIIKEAEDLISKNAIDNLYPSIQEVASFVSQYNFIAEMEGLPSVSSLLEIEWKGESNSAQQDKKYRRNMDDDKGWKGEDRSGVEHSNSVATANEKARREALSKSKSVQGPKGTAMRYERFKNTMRSLKNSAAKAGKTIKGAATSKAGKITGAVLGAAAVAAAGVAAYRAYKNRQCAGVDGEQKQKCMKAAAAQGLRAAQASMSSCKSASNPEKCQKAAQKEVEKWKARVAKY